MARNVEGPRPGRKRDFIPESFGNTEDQDPIVVTIKDPSEGEKRTLMLLQSELGFEDGEMLRDANGLPQIHITLEAMTKFQKEAITRHVTKVTNYCVRGVDIINGHSLSEHGETEIIAEVCLEITTAFSLSDEEKKTSEDSSDFRQAKTLPGNGTAENASIPNSPNNATVTEDQISLSYTSPS